ncbi:hypothetical protein QO058_04480 [Bosea vestrisii]|uniref:hypothetical protein n=1 Tax=Bosea vestrisii TaxID=151416 RepID=UPI0024DF8A97|nr:hypothetical protein [Bosea vestrisii]WID97529.1 hypothetical protein QO058_04480 [Bosea vestrisii]
MKSSDFRIVTNADRRRIANIVASTVLSYEHMTAKSNRYIAILIGHTETGVREIRLLMKKMGTLGTRKGELPELPRIPETTWGRLHLAIADAEELSELAEMHQIKTPLTKALRQLRGRAIRLTTGKDVELTDVAALADSLTAATELASGECDRLIPPLSDAARKLIELPAYEPTARELSRIERHIAALPRRSEMLQ